MPAPRTLITKIVQAGAGTGKTESLALEIIAAAKEFYSQKKVTPHFVATTFTDQATAELRERVALIAEQHEPWLFDFVKDQERLTISTMHGVFAKLLHRYGAKLELDPEFTILTLEDEKKILNKVFRSIL